MDIVRCDKGHFYDASMHASCPQCAEEAARGGAFGGDSAAVGGGADMGSMMTGKYSMDSIGPTEPVSMMRGNAPEGLGPTVPASGGFSGSEFVGAGDMSAPKVESYDATMPVWSNQVQGFNPVVGWLVCVEGPDRGTDYRIRGGYNYIGRAQSMDICIMNDSHVSKDRHALIAYDDETRTFYFAPSGGKNIVRVNNDAVIAPVKLAADDVVTIGTTKLRFVPLCGENFSWGED